MSEEPVRATGIIAPDGRMTFDVKIRKDVGFLGKTAFYSAETIPSKTGRKKILVTIESIFSDDHKGPGRAVIKG